MIFSINSVLLGDFKANSRSLSVLRVFDCHPYGTLINKNIMIFNVIRVPFIELNLPQKPNLKGVRCKLRL